MLTYNKLNLMMLLIVLGFQSELWSQTRRTDPNGQGSFDRFHARGEEKMGDWATLRRDTALTRSYKWTRLSSTVRKAAANFLVEDNLTTVAITFSAEVWSEQVDRSVYIRLLIDGVPMAPADVLFAHGKVKGTRAFTFSAVVEAGFHTAEVEWSASREGGAELKDMSLLIRQSQGGGLKVKTAPSGPSIVTNSNAWQPVPDMTDSIFVDNNQTLTASLSAETYVTKNRRLFLRALVNGVPMAPSDVVLTQDRDPQCRKMTFGAGGLAPGWVTVSFEWLVDSGAKGYMGDRTLELAALSSGNGDSISLFKAAPSGASIDQPTENYQAVPDMELFTGIPNNATIAVQFGGEMSVKGNGQLQARLTIGGIAVAGSEVEMTADDSSDIHSYVLIAKNVNLGQNTLFTTVGLEWRKLSGDAAILGDRSMNVLIQSGDTPDFAEPPLFGNSGYTVEPAFGKRNIVTILIDPQEPGGPAVPNALAMDQFLFQNPRNITGYYDAVSKGRVELNNVATLGWFQLDFDFNHYWNANYDCDNGDTFVGGHSERWAEAITKASTVFNFADYDFNKDGLLDPRTELGILLIVPQTGGDGVHRSLDPYCSGAKFTTDGVIVPEIVESYILDLGTQWMTPAHELAHMVFFLDDMYVTDHAADPENLTLMAELGSGRTMHVDPINKTALSWTTPRVVTAGGAFELADIRDGGDVLFLPRNDSDSKEYYVLENRQKVANHPDYDENLSDSGIAIWHAVENTVQNDQAPNCVSQAFWNGVSDNNARRGIRLLRPTNVYSNANALWDSGDYNLFDNGLVCPGGLGPIRNALLWADGSPSGYWITNWSMAANLMFFDILVF